MDYLRAGTCGWTGPACGEGSRRASGAPAHGLPVDSAADLLGLSAEVGTLEPGKSADLIAVKGDPLTDIRELERVTFVMHEGVVHTSPAR